MIIPTDDEIRQLIRKESLTNESVLYDNIAAIRLILNKVLKRISSWGAEPCPHHPGSQFAFKRGCGRCMETLSLQIDSYLNKTTDERTRRNNESGR